MKERVKYRWTGTAREHVLVAEKALGKPLDRNHPVHHVDGNGLNNTNSNLVICESHKYHHLLHIRQRIVDLGGDPNTHKICSGCGLCLRSDFWKSQRNTDGLFCYCKKCGMAKNSIKFQSQRPEQKKRTNDRRNDRRRAAREHKRSIHPVTAGGLEPEPKSLLQSTLRPV